MARWASSKDPKFAEGTFAIAKNVGNLWRNNRDRRGDSASAVKKAASRTKMTNVFTAAAHPRILEGKENWPCRPR